jgi:uncharacterized RDD family membrane protein YckC
MSSRLVCHCGAQLETPASQGGASGVVCARCGRTVRADEAAPSAGSDGGADSTVRLGDSSRCELIRDTEGREWWKMACVCGKRVRSPARATQAYGKCPRCSRRLKLPGFLLTQKPVLLSASPGEAPVGAPARKKAEPPSPKNPPQQKSPQQGWSDADIGFDDKSETRSAIMLRDDGIPILVDDETETVATEVVLVDVQINQAAFQHIATRLRPSQAGGEETLGRISAWPLAGFARRALAAFIDFTLATLLAGVILALASFDVLPRVFLRVEVLFVLLVLAGWLNDGILQLLLGETVGKRLVLVVTRTLDGAELPLQLLLLRAFLKWLIVPGWLIALADPNQRALHDLICGTLVLKGRARRMSVPQSDDPARLTPPPPAAKDA